MMIRRMLLVFVLLFAMADAQYTFTAEEVKAMQAKVENLVKTNELQTLQISQQTELIARFEYQAGLDSLLLEYKDEQILILDDRVEIYRVDREVSKQKWYTSPEFYRVEGMAIIVISAYVIGLVGR